MTRPISANIKASLVIIAVIIIIGLLWYSQSIVEKIQERERQIANLYAKTIQHIGNPDINSQSDLTFLFDEIIQTPDFPIILSDADNTPSSFKNMEIDTSLSETERLKTAKEIMYEMDKINAPIYIRVDNQVVSIVHYGESYLVKQLKSLPILEIIIAIIFALVGYVGFSYIKRSEQSNIWVGMAKETAHQLGTPLSSIMGWLELLKINESIDNKAQDQLNEIENDLQRLNKVASRFSKIGSVPDLKPEKIEDVIQKVIKYFERRIPQMSKKVVIDISNKTVKTKEISINAELFEWVLENLIKNALDAFENNTGKINIMLTEEDNCICIDVVDTGKGIEEKLTKDVFRPGFSTKKRGWGLGLSLSKRIIEEYHKGKLFIKETAIGK
jgi:signal transduction histidine kinase